MKWAGLLAIMLLLMELAYGCSRTLTSKGPIHHRGTGHDSGSKW
jgi:hypothetical protein